MNTLITILQLAAALALVVLLAVQTSKAEQGGVMGIGAAGGRGSSDVDMLVGTERILKPLTKFVAVGFLALSLLNAIPNVNFGHFFFVLAIYVVAMRFGGIVWKAITGGR